MVEQFYRDGHEISYRDYQRSLTLLAEVDNSSGYDIDEHGIYLDPQTGKFIYLGASGCSCWDGDYFGIIANTLPELKEALLDSAGAYVPAIKSTEALIREAQERLLI